MDFECDYIASGLKGLGKPSIRLEFEDNADLLDFVDKEGVKAKITPKKKGGGKEDLLNPSLNGLGAREILDHNGKYIDTAGYSPSYEILSDYSHLIESGNNTRVKITMGGLTETLPVIKDTTNNFSNQVKQLANHLKADSLEQSAFNVWHWMVTNIKYKLDANGKEEIRTPARSYNDRFTGIDCDDFSILAASLLKNMGYDPVFHIVAFYGKQQYGHIYVVVNNIVVDGVMKEYGKHPDGITKTKKMSLSIEVLNGFGDLPEIYGFNVIAPPDDYTLKLIQAQSQIINSGMSGPRKKLTAKQQAELRKMRYMIKMNGSPDRDLLKDVMPFVDDIDRNGNFVFRNEETAQEVISYMREGVLNGLDESDDYEIDIEIDELSGLGKSANAKEKAERKARRAKRKEEKGNLWQRAKKAVKKVAKKVVKAIVRFNPITITARNGYLLMLKLNIFGQATKLGSGMLDESQAKSKGYDLSEWRKARASYQKAVKYFEKAGGKKKNIDKEIERGMDKKPFLSKDIRQELNGLGEPATAAAGAVATSAPFWKKIGSWFKGINFKKLFGKKEEKKAQFIGSAAADEKQSGFKKLINGLKDKIFNPKKDAVNDGFNDQTEQDYWNDESDYNPDGSDDSKSNTMIYVALGD